MHLDIRYSWFFFSLPPSLQFTPPKAFLNSKNETVREIVCTEHVISSFVFFDLLLLVTYWFGLYLFSRGETEYLSNLAEKVRGHVTSHDLTMVVM